MREFTIAREMVAMRTRCILALIASFTVAVAPGCSRILDDALNPKYCAAHPTDTDCVEHCAAHPTDNECTPADASVDAPAGCTSSSQCSAPTPACATDQMTCVQCTATDHAACTGATPACATDQMTCVQCTAADQRACTGTTPACATDRMTCVQCTATEHEACTGTAPVCDASDVCRACTVHPECSSEACLPSGACGDDTTVAYVDPAGSGTSCTKASPCVSVADALKTGRTFVKLHGTTDELVSIDSRDVTFLADPGAQLTSTKNGVLLEIRGASHVAIYDLEITGASGMGAIGAGISLPTGFTGSMDLHGVKITSNAAAGISASGGTLTVTGSTLSSNQGGGISVTGGMLTVTQSALSSNQGAAISATGTAVVISRSEIAANPGGGVSVSGAGATFDITNSYITYNGLASGPRATQLGGVALLPNDPRSRFEYNTVAFNGSDGSIFAGGVTCAGAMASAAGNLLYGNAEGATTDDTTQKRGACQFGNTLALGSTPGDLGFNSPRASPFDFHLTAASPSTVVDAGGICTGPDFDGDARPIGNACDLGADEVR